jgi:hypothetical protein
MGTVVEANTLRLADETSRETANVDFQLFYPTNEEQQMKATKLFIAAGFVLASSTAVAEVGVGTLQIESVTNVYGRAALPTVAVKSPVKTGGAEVATSGRTQNDGGIQSAVTANVEARAFGRS